MSLAPFVLISTSAVKNEHIMHIVALLSRKNTALSISPFTEPHKLDQDHQLFKQ